MHFPHTLEANTPRWEMIRLCTSSTCAHKDFFKKRRILWSPCSLCGHHVHQGIKFKILRNCYNERIKDMMQFVRNCNFSKFVKCAWGMKGLSDYFDVNHSDNLRNLGHTWELHSKLMPKSGVLQKSQAKPVFLRNRKVKKSNSLSKITVILLLWGKSIKWYS